MAFAGCHTTALTCSPEALIQFDDALAHGGGRCLELGTSRF
jgi:hypothetical protein